MPNKRLRGMVLIIFSILLMSGCCYFFYGMLGKQYLFQVGSFENISTIINFLQFLKLYWYSLAIIPLLLLAYIVSYRGRKHATGVSHGSARFADIQEIKFMWHPVKRSQIASRLVLGTFKRRLISLTNEQIENHLLLVAPTGGGKTSNIILPNILQETGYRSIFVIDPKQELVAKSAGAVQQRFNHVWVFAPTTPDQSIQYNPLAHILGIDDARDFAMCWIQNTGQSKEPFWDRVAEILITALVLHLKEAEQPPSLYRLAEIFSGKSFDEIKMLFRTSRSKEAKELAYSLLNNLEKNDKLAGSVMTDLANRFFVLHSPSIRQVTQKNDINFDLMDEEAIALYLAIPFADAERLKPLSACFMMQMFRAWIRRADIYPNKRLKRGITCYLDEFANAGRIPYFESYISTLRSKGVGLIIAIQNISQLDVLYEKTGRNTILSNSKTQLLLPGAGQEECEYFSTRMGETTVFTESHNQSENREVSLLMQREGWSQNRVARALMTPDEIRRMPSGSILVVTDRLAPLLLQAQPYYRNAELVKRSLITWVNPFYSQETLDILASPVWNSGKHEGLREQAEPEQLKTLMAADMPHDWKESSLDEELVVDPFVSPQFYEPLSMETIEASYQPHDQDEGEMMSPLRKKRRGKRGRGKKNSSEDTDINDNLVLE